jgi:DNA replication protein DnaC
MHSHNAHNINGMNGMGSMNSNMMIENLKSMMLTMAMVKNTNSTQGDSSSTFINTIIFLIIVSSIDTITLQIRNAFNVICAKFNNYISRKTKDLSLISNLSSFTTNKVKTASIIIKIETSTKNPTSDAVIDLLTNLPHTKCILLKNGVYTINYNETIEISKGLYAQLVNNSSSQLTTTIVKDVDSPQKEHSNNVVNEQKSTQGQGQGQGQEQQDHSEVSTPFGYIDIHSHTLNMEELRNELNNIVKNYLIKMTNKLGNNIYFFSEFPVSVYRDANGKIDHSKMPECLHFTMKQFITNRSFKNLFGKNIDIVRKRVEFFKDNKDWYDNKGVPYTLGILVSGSPGSGKTSLIKCIANELKRHIINIHLTDNMTKTQIENLFYNEQISVTQNGKTEIYTIPINRRIYVLEDVDCQCDFILDRGTQTIEQVLAKKNAELKKEVEQLKFALSEMALGKKAIINSHSQMNTNETKEDKNSNQKITLSFLLNLFDGVLETPGRITFMTTNFIDKLDKAFTRPGRIDVISKFGFADYSQIISIIEHRYDAILTSDQLSFIYNLNQCITPAEISRILFENFDNLDGALKGLENYIEEYNMVQSEKETKEQNLKNNVLMLEKQANDETKVVQTTPLSVIDTITQQQPTQEPTQPTQPIQLRQQPIQLTQPTQPTQQPTQPTQPTQPIQLTQSQQLTPQQLTPQQLTPQQQHQQTQSQQLTQEHLRQLEIYKMETQLSLENIFGNSREENNIKLIAREENKMFTPPFTGFNGFNGFGGSMGSYIGDVTEQTINE